MGKKIKKAIKYGKKAYQYGDRFLGALVTAQRNIEKNQKKKKGKKKSYQFELPDLA
jgi:hypothetical protein